MTDIFYNQGQEERLKAATAFIHNWLSIAFNVAESVIFNSKDEYDYYDDDYDDEPFEDDVWADANALASAGWGTDEDYGYFGDEGDW